MPTVIDALVVTLGLDAKTYEAGAAKATQTRQNLSSMATKAAKVDTDLARKHRDEQDRQAKADEANAKRTIEGIQRIRNELLGLFALITAGRGVKALVGDIVSGDAATGRLAANLGLATGELAAWQGAAERSGGTAAGITSSLQSLSTEFERFKLTGEGGDFIPWLQNLGVSLVDSQGKMKSLTALYLDLADAMKAQSAPDAIFKGARMGMDAGTASMLHQQGRAGMQRLLDEQYKLGVPDDRDAKNAQALQNDIKDLQQAFVGVARTILEGVTPAIHGMLQELDQWIQANGPRLRAELLDKVKEFVAFMRQVDWHGIGTQIEHVAGSINSVVQALGGWKTATEAIFALWSLGKVKGLLSALSLFKLGVPGAVLGGAGGTLGTVAGAAVAAAPVLAPALLKGDTAERSPGDPEKDGIFEVIRRLMHGEKLTGEATPEEKARTAAQDDADQKKYWEARSKVEEGGLATLGDVLGQLVRFLENGTSSTTPAAQRYDDATPSERRHAGLLLGAGTPAPDDATQTARAKQAYDYYTKEGFSPAQASGLVARMKLESGFNPGAVGDNGAAYGAFQWHQDRRAKIEAYLGKSLIGSSFEDQLKGSVYELRQGQEQAAGKVLAGALTPEGAGDIVSRRYIRPGLTEGMKDWEASRTAALAARYNRTFTTPPTPAAPAPSAPSWPGGVPLSALVPSPGDRYSGTQYASTDNSTKAETHIGTVTVHTQATDAKGIAAGIKGALARNDAGNAMMAAQMNRGLA